MYSGGGKRLLLLLLLLLLYSILYAMRPLLVFCYYAVVCRELPLRGQKHGPNAGTHTYKNHPKFDILVMSEFFKIAKWTKFV